MARKLITIIFFVVVRHASAEEVTLKFNWPHRTQLQVTRSFERIERKEGAVIETFSKCEYKWVAVRDGENYRIEFSDFRFIVPELKPTLSDPVVQLEYVSRMIEPILPTIIVDMNAQPVGMDNLDRVKKEITDALASIPGLAEDPLADRFAEMLTTDEVIRDRALQDWNKMVQVWSGNETETGTINTIESPMPLPTGGSITKRLEYTIGNLVECGKENSEPECIELALKETPSSGQARAMLQAMLGVDLVTALGAPESSTLEMRASYSTVAKVESMIPVRFVKEKFWSVTWPENKKMVSRQDKWTYGFKVQD